MKLTLSEKNKSRLIHATGALMLCAMVFATPKDTFQQWKWAYGDNCTSSNPITCQQQYNEEQKAQ